MHEYREREISESNQSEKVLILETKSNAPTVRFTEVFATQLAAHIVELFVMTTPHRYKSISKSKVCLVTEKTVRKT